MYYLVEINEHSQDYKNKFISIKRLIDIQRHNVADGTTYRVYKSRYDMPSRIHDVYTVKDGFLVPANRVSKKTGNLNKLV